MDHASRHSQISEVTVGDAPASIELLAAVLVAVVVVNVARDKAPA